MKTITHRPGKTWVVGSLAWLGFVALAELGASPPATAAAPAAGCRPGESPRVIRVVSVPTVPNATFAIDGNEYRLSAQGTTTAVACPVHNASRVTGSGPPVKINPLTRARYSRVFSSEGGTLLHLAFAQDYMVGLTFSGLPASSVQSWTVKSSTGEERTYQTTAPQWMQGSRVLRGANGLEQRLIYQTVDSVIVHGVNVVVKSQVKFLPSETQSVRVPLLAFKLQVHVVDRIFGFPTGDQVSLTSAKRPTITAGLKSGRAVLPAVPRGEFILTASAPGLRFGRPLTVSRDQLVILPVLSYLDLATLVGLPLLVAAGLILAPRPTLRRRLRRALIPAKWMAFVRTVPSLLRSIRAHREPAPRHPPDQEDQSLPEPPRQRGASSSAHS